MGCPTTCWCGNTPPDMLDAIADLVAREFRSLTVEYVVTGTGFRLTAKTKAPPQMTETIEFGEDAITDAHGRLSWSKLSGCVMPPLRDLQGRYREARKVMLERQQRERAERQRQLEIEQEREAAAADAARRKTQRVIRPTGMIQERGIDLLDDS